MQQNKMKNAKKQYTVAVIFNLDIQQYLQRIRGSGAVQEMLMGEAL